MNPDELKPNNEVPNAAVTPESSVTPAADAPATATTPVATINPITTNPPISNDSTVVMGGSNQATTTVQASSKGSKFNLFKKFGMVPTIVIAIVVLLGGGAGAYFGVILPNSPAHIWKSSMENTSKGMDKLVEYQKQFENMKGSKVNGEIKADAEGVVFDGKFDGKSDEKTADFKAEISAAGSKINVDMLTNIPDGSKSPDLYMRVKGLDAFASLFGATAPEYAKLFTSANNQWYVVDHTLFDQMSSMSGTDSEAFTTPTAQEMYELEEAMIKVTNQYMFTIAADKAVLVVRQNVGSEDLNGRKTYHYVVGFNKENLKEYVTALVDAIQNTSYGKKFPDLDKSLNIEELHKDIDKMADDEKADVWVDKSTKLIRSVKFTDKKRQSDFFQLSLNYDGGKVYPMEFKIHATEGSTTDVTFNMNIDTEKKTTAYELKVDHDETGAKFNMTAKMNTEATNDTVEFKKPTDAKSFYELVGLLYGDYGTGPQDVLGDSTILDNFDL